MPFYLLRNDITKMECEAIVNPSNPYLKQGRGTSYAIFQAAGESQLTKACQKIGYCELTKAVITSGFSLSKYIIHVACPEYDGIKKQAEQLLYQSYLSCLELAKVHHIKSIAFPLLSSGYYHYPKEIAYQIALHVIQDFLSENEMNIYLVLYDSQSIQVVHTEIEQYIDDHYVDIHYECYTRNVCTYSIEDLMKQQNETFSQMLLRKIDKKNLKDSTVYKKANIDRRHFSKIRSQKNYQPTKKIVLCLAIALELSLDETIDLLMKAGFAFSNASKFDLIIQYYIENKNYDIYQINQTLFDYHLEILG
ncbi:macro domain-containing protein [Floccifex sp.]|uniref:macro domain-containing protein n=1 Tax=Floccifex sp. TaxID=2815810 RepID=UPI003F053810